MLPAVLAMLVATQGYSVLYLFLVADLVCAAAVFPTYYGLFARRFSGTAAMIATLVGIIAGAFYFPDPTFSRGSLFQSFLIAFTVPALLSLLLGQLHLGERFDFQRLKERVVAIGE
jgi:Na+(H+)/acetate symporter ActP